MKDIEIFDKDGKALHIADVIARFLEQKANENAVRTNNVAIYYRDRTTIQVAKVSANTGECCGNIEYCSSNGL